METIVFQPSIFLRCENVSFRDGIPLPPLFPKANSTQLGTPSKCPERGCHYQRGAPPQEIPHPTVGDGRSSTAGRCLFEQWSNISEYISSTSIFGDRFNKWSNPKTKISGSQKNWNSLPYTSLVVFRNGILPGFDQKSQGFDHPELRGSTVHGDHRVVPHKLLNRPPRYICKSSGGNFGNKRLNLSPSKSRGKVPIFCSLVFVGR